MEADVTPTELAVLLANPELTLEELVASGDRESELLRAATAVVDTYKAEIKKRLEALGFQPGQSFLPDTMAGRGVLYSARTTPRSLDRELLVLEGICGDVLDRCTVGGEPGKPFVQFVRPREGKGR